MQQHIRYYFIFQLIFVSLFVLMSSLGAFFHFLLDHEISVVENWLHNNTWEMLVLSKSLAFYLIMKWFSIRLYEASTIKELFKRFLNWPRPEAVVVSVFSLISFIALARTIPSEHNYLYWYHYLASYGGIFLFYGLEFLLLTYLYEVFGPIKDERKQVLAKVFFLILFMIGYRVSIPDYYHMAFFSAFCFATLLYLSEREIKNWSNVVCFLILFICPMASFFGFDPVWGSDYSYFRFQDKFNNSLMALVWVISFCYYKFRNQIILSFKKLKR